MSKGDNIRGMSAAIWLKRAKIIRISGNFSQMVAQPANSRLSSTRLLADGCKYCRSRRITFVNDRSFTWSRNTFV